MLIDLGRRAYRWGCIPLPPNGIRLLNATGTVQELYQPLGGRLVERILPKGQRQLLDRLVAAPELLVETRTLDCEGTRCHCSVERSEQFECLLRTTGTGESAGQPGRDLPPPMSRSHPPSLSKGRNRRVAVAVLKVQLGDRELDIRAPGA